MSLANTIYLVDDEASILETVQFALEREGFTVRAFYTGQACLNALTASSPRLILLDVGLTDGNGFEFFRHIREYSSAPIIFLTARNDEIDKVVGLEMGAEDYIVKPFSLRELVARVRVVLRRHASKIDSHPVSATVRSLFKIDNACKEIYYHGVKLSLTAHEFRLLQVFLAQPGRVFSRAQLLDQAWDAPEHRLERTIDSHIKSLRLKLRDIAIDADPIRTCRGMGYSVVIEE